MRQPILAFRGRQEAEKRLETRHLTGSNSGRSCVTAITITTRFLCVKVAERWSGTIWAEDCLQRIEPTRELPFPSHLAPEGGF